MCVQKRRSFKHPILFTPCSPATRAVPTVISLCPSHHRRRRRFGVRFGGALLLMASHGAVGRASESDGAANGIDATLEKGLWRTVLWDIFACSKLFDFSQPIELSGHTSLVKATHSLQSGVETLQPVRPQAWAKATAKNMLTPLTPEASSKLCNLWPHKVLFHPPQ